MEVGLGNWVPSKLVLAYSRTPAAQRTKGLNRPSPVDLQGLAELLPTTRCRDQGFLHPQEQKDHHTIACDKASQQTRMSAVLAFD